MIPYSMDMFMGKGSSATSTDKTSSGPSDDGKEEEMSEIIMPQGDGKWVRRCFTNKPGCKKHSK